MENNYNYDAERLDVEEKLNQEIGEALKDDIKQKSLTARISGKTKYGIKTKQPKTEVTKYNLNEIMSYSKWNKLDPKSQLLTLESYIEKFKYKGIAEKWPIKKGSIHSKRYLLKKYGSLQQPPINLPIDIKDNKDPAYLNMRNKSIEAPDVITQNIEPIAIIETPEDAYKILNEINFIYIDTHTNIINNCLDSLSLIIENQMEINIIIAAQGKYKCTFETLDLFNKDTLQDLILTIKSLPQNLEYKFQLKATEK